jgi:hypothetical protein
MSLFLLIQPLNPKPILEFRVACMINPLNYEIGDTEMDMGVVER